MSQKQLWFKAKLYGWGWYPVSWQGWVLTLLYALGLVGFILKTDKAEHSVSDTLLAFAFPFVVLSLLFLGICYATGERPGWRWGK